jgi:hypothetical protein
MSEQQNTGFGKFIPGFDFLQNLAKGASQNMPQMPSLSNWVAPTLNVEELDKRIGELKAVRFWLEQNSNALAATIQALEVQKMTLATLKGMNFSMGEVADALKLKTPADLFGAAAPKARQQPPAEAPLPEAPAAAGQAPGQSAKDQAAPQAVDPLQWWGALTQQFQQIAANAMQDVGAAGAAASVPAAAKVKAAPAKKTRPAGKRAPRARRAPGKAATR